VYLHRSGGGIGKPQILSSAIADFGNRCRRGSCKKVNPCGISVAIAKKINSKLLQFIPRDNIVQRAEINRKTVIDYDSFSPQAEVYRSIAHKIVYNKDFTIPAPMSIDDLESLMREFGVAD